MFENSWENAKGIHICFIDREEAYDCVLQEKFWAVFQEDSVEDHLLLATVIAFLQTSLCPVPTALTQNHSSWVLNSGRDVCCRHSSS